MLLALERLNLCHRLKIWHVCSQAVPTWSLKNVSKWLVVRVGH